MVMNAGSADTKQRNKLKGSPKLEDGRRKTRERRMESERDGRRGLSEDAKQKEKRKVVKDGRREGEGRKISSPGGINSHLSN